jgi:hypothetical protein
MDRRKIKPNSYDVFHDNLRLFGFRSYEHYLASNQWRLFNELYRRSKLPQRCLGCSHQSFVLHHWTYERVCAEDLSDVIPLCVACHTKLHKWLLDTGSPLGNVIICLTDCFGFTENDAIVAWKPFSDIQVRLRRAQSISRPIYRRDDRRTKKKEPQPPKAKKVPPEPKPRGECIVCNKRLRLDKMTGDICDRCRISGRVNRNLRDRLGLP